ncbi:MAG: aldolase/citrate lyase family protein [Acidimicrobiales bacterium]|nr:aldolase/citrate lyase family protein [Acidimicrobiales bacterium]|tara:strand:+ start:6156 stop:6911 length:756 start_codon:yes stop_codon:yes gene_type:complete
MGFMKLPEKFTSDDTAFGCWLKVPSSVTAEVAALSGFDYVCIDMQHGFSDRNDLIPMLQAIQPHSPRAIVRVPSNEPSVIGWALDAGATGVIVPLVNSAEEAEKAVKACLYPSKGNRSMGPTRAERVFGEEYVQGVENSIQCLPMIETLDALNNLESILSVDGVDSIYVGPSDLSVNLGLPKGNNDGNPKFDEALEMIVSSCEKYNVVPGIHANSSLADIRQQQGFRILTVVEDDGAMSTGFGEVFNQMKS